MQTYQQFSPTQFDIRGLGLPNRQDWLVAPVSQTRDSGPLDRSNFNCFVRELGGESDTVEIHRFGHWGPSWFEIILIDPNSKAAEMATELESALADYPVVDESHLSELEFTEACETWEQASIRERIYECDRYGVNIFAARRDELPETPTGELMFNHC